MQLRLKLTLIFQFEEVFLVHSNMYIFVLLFCKWKLFRRMNYTLTLNTKNLLTWWQAVAAGCSQSVLHLLLCTEQVSVRRMGSNFCTWENWDLLTLFIILKDANWGLHLFSTLFKLIPTVRNAWNFLLKMRLAFHNQNNVIYY